MESNVSIQKRISNSAFILKAMAIFSVICAHCPYDTDSVLSCVLNNLGVIGVPIFFFLSGFFYRTKKYDFKELLIKKLKTLILPWFFCGIVVYLYVAVRKGGDLLAMANFLIGNGSFLYYMPVVFLFYVIFYFIKDNRGLIIIMALVSLIWMVVQGVYSPLVDFVYPYLNPLNWMLYFSFGIYVQYYANVEKAILLIEKFKWVLIAAGGVTFILLAAINYKLSYWNILFPAVECICFLGMLALSFEKWMGNKLILDIGKESFAIYLLHMPIVGITNLLLVHYVIYCIRPFFILAIIYFCVKLYVFICDKMKCAWLKNFIGAR